jgi:large subunit ribosomal protein L22
MPTTKKNIIPTKAKTTSKVVKSETPNVAVPVLKETKTAKFLNKNVKISPRKLRLITPVIKKLKPQEALDRLKFTNTKAARIFYKAIQSIIADSKNNHHLNPETLRFDSIRVDEGMKLKRMDKSHGSRFARGLIQKRHSRIEIILKGELN